MKQKIKNIFDSKILPDLGKIKSKEKYIHILTELALNSGANKGKGLREAQISEDLQPAKHILDKLADKGFVEITLPVGDGTMLNDPINNKRQLFNKQKMIEDYFERFRNHVSNDISIKETVKDILNLVSESELKDWLNSLDDKYDFKEYNQVVFGMLAKGHEIKIQGYGPLQWRSLAKFYNISEAVKNMLEDEKK